MYFSKGDLDLFFFFFNLCLVSHYLAVSIGTACQEMVAQGTHCSVASGVWAGRESRGDSCLGIITLAAGLSGRLCLQPRSQRGLRGTQLPGVESTCWAMLSWPSLWVGTVYHVNDIKRLGHRFSAQRTCRLEWEKCCPQCASEVKVGPLTWGSWSRSVTAKSKCWWPTAHHLRKMGIRAEDGVPGTLVSKAAAYETVH